MFRDYIAAAVLLHQKFSKDNSYNKEYSLSKIRSKLKGFKWQKMEKVDELLSDTEINTKICKAFNDMKKT